MMRIVFVLLCMCRLWGYSQTVLQADSLLKFVLTKNTSDTLKPNQTLTWNDLHTLTAHVNLYGLAAHYGITHRQGVIYFEIKGSTPKKGFVSLGITEIPFVLSAKTLHEFVAIYSFLKMYKVMGRAQIGVQSILLKNEQQQSLKLEFSEKQSLLFEVSGKDSVW